MPAAGVRRLGRSNASKLDPHPTLDEGGTPIVTPLVSLPRHDILPVVKVSSEVAHSLKLGLMALAHLLVMYSVLHGTLWWVPYSSHKHVVDFGALDWSMFGSLCLFILAYPCVVVAHYALVSSRTPTTRPPLFWLTLALTFLLGVAYWVGLLCCLVGVARRHAAVHFLSLFLPPITGALVFGSRPRELARAACTRLARLFPSALGAVGSAGSAVTYGDEGASATDDRVAGAQREGYLGAGGVSSKESGASPSGATTPEWQPSNPCPWGVPKVAWNDADDSICDILTRPVHHACSMSSETVRAEVATLTANFNWRLKMVVFETWTFMYYSIVMPLMFTEMPTHASHEWMGFACVFRVVSTLIEGFLHRMPTPYVDALYMATLHLGKWQRVEGRQSHIPHGGWSDQLVWQKGILVKHVRGWFKAEGINNAAEPGNTTHLRFYAAFSYPWVLQCALCAVSIVLIIAELVLLARIPFYQHQISFLLHAPFNYMAIARSFRDLAIMMKVYKKESLVQ